MIPASEIFLACKLLLNAVAILHIAFVINILISED